MTDVRLALGYGAFAIAAACALWDYQLGFENTKTYTAIAVAVYTILQGALALWISKVEEGTVYQGTAPSGQQVCAGPPPAREFRTDWDRSSLAAQQRRTSPSTG